MKSKEEIKEEINMLLSDGRMILYHEALQKGNIDDEQKKELEEYEEYRKYKKQFHSIKTSYQKWYTTALPVIRQLAPERYGEFQAYYHIDKRKEIDFLTYTISDYLLGLVITRGLYKEEVVNPFSAFYSKFENQLSILDSCVSIIDSLLNDIEGVLQSNLFENELEAVKDLLKKNHLRAAGTLAGVTLETHLSKVCSNHGIKFRKKNPTISDYNEKLKKEDIIDLPTWRLIQRLGDIRNLSAHSKEREPTKDEIEDLIRGCEKLIAEVF